MQEAVDTWLAWVLGGGVFLLGMLLASWAKSTLISALSRLQPNQSFEWLGRWVFVAIVLISLVAALDAVGVEVTTLMAGLGITGAAIGFACKDLISHPISGMLLLIYRPFKVGDHVVVKGYEGRVMDMNFRHVVLQEGKKKVLVPNAVLLAEPVRITKEKEDA